MSGRQNPPATQSNPEILKDEDGTPIPHYIFPNLPSYTPDEFEKRFIMSQSDSDAIQKIDTTHQGKALIKCSEHFVDKKYLFEMKVKRKHILNMIVNDDKKKVREAFKRDAKRKHADGPFYWSDTTFNTYMVIFRHETIDTVYYCKNMYVLAHLDPATGELKSLLRQARKPFLTEDPACETDDKDFKETARALDPTPAMKSFQDNHILDPTNPRYEGYEAWGWEDWKRYVFEGDPKLSPPETEKQHTILIANKKLLYRGFLRKVGVLISVLVPCEMYIIILEGKNVKKVYRHLNAHPEIQKPDERVSDSVYVLNGCYSSLRELQGYLTISDCELVNRHGRPIAFQRFMTKHVLDPNSWEASLMKGYGAWSGYKWNYWYRTRRETLKEKYNFVGLKTVILASETKIRETFQNPSCPISVRKNRKFVWSWDCLFVVMFDGSKDNQVNPYNTNTKACPEFYIRVGYGEYRETGESGTEVSIRLPTHFDAVGHVRLQSLLITEAKALCVPVGTQGQIHGFDTAKPSGTCGDRKNQQSAQISASKSTTPAYKKSVDAPQPAKSAWGKPTMQITGVQAYAGQSIGGTIVSGGAVAPGSARVPASTQYQQGPSQGGASGGQYGGSGQRGSYGQSQRGSGGQGSGTSMGGNGGYRGNSDRGGNGGYRGNSNRGGNGGYRGNSNRGGNPDSSYRGRGGRGRN